MGGCGWARCPRKSVLNHIAQDTARSWFWDGLTQTAHIQAIFGNFWAVSGTYRGVRGQQRALCPQAIQARVEYSNHFSSFFRSCLGFRAVLGQKRLFSGTKCAVLGGHLRTWRPRPGAQVVIFWLKTWIWQGSRLWDGQSRVEPGAMRRSNGQNEKEKCLLLLLACLLARFNGRWGGGVGWVGWVGVQVGRFGVVRGGGGSPYLPLPSI